MFRGVSSVILLLFSLSLSLAASEKEEWVQNALTIQRSLVSSLSIASAPLVGTHNSYSSGIYGGTILRNQNLSLTAQFEIGVRYIELDLHYIPKLNSSGQGPYRICHSSSGVYDACNSSVGWPTCNSYGVQDYGEDTGCSATTPNYAEMFKEIAEWLFTNPGNVIVINFDDSISDDDVIIAGADMNTTVNAWIKTVFADAVYTPLDLITDKSSWPTIQSLITRGKRIIMNTNKHNFGGVYVHSDFRGYVWPASKIKYFVPYPACTSNYTNIEGRVPFGFFQEDLLIIDFRGNILYDGAELVGTFNNQLTSEVMQCQYSTFFDYFSVDSAATLVWSWDVNQPSTHSCASMNPSSGRWESSDCTSSYYFACQSNTNSELWTISAAKSPRNKVVCPSGTTFATPITANENIQLQKIANVNNGNIWISLAKNDRGAWVPEAKSTTTSGANYVSVSLNLVIVFVFGWLFL